MPAKPFKFAIITDIHYGVDTPIDGQFKWLPSRALSLLRYLVNRMNSELVPSFVLQLGNAIEAEDDETDLENYETIIDAFKPLKMPVYHVVGSHEQVNLDSKAISTLLKYPKLYYSFDVDAFHFVVLFSKSRNHADIHIDDVQQKWLAEDLNSSKHPTVVFVHHPIDEQDLDGNYLFDTHPEQCFVEERAAVREILARSGKVIAVFSGHVHRNNLQDHDGIHYVTLQSLIANMTKTGKTPSESFAVVTLLPNEVRVEVEGMDQAEYRISV